MTFQEVVSTLTCPFIIKEFGLTWERKLVTTTVLTNLVGKATALPNPVELILLLPELAGQI